jgi:hypothetical protein
MYLTKPWIPSPPLPFQELEDVRTSQNRRQLCQVDRDCQILVLQLFQILANRPFAQRNNPDIPLVVYSPRGTDPVLVAINKLPHNDVDHFVNFGMVVVLDVYYLADFFPIHGKPFDVNCRN